MAHILVTGATGQQGGATARELLKSDETVRLLSRSPARLQPLADRGAQLARGDLLDKESLATALDGIERAFLITSWEQGTDTEILQGKTFIDAAKQAGVNTVVLTSVANSDTNTGIDFFESKGLIEKHLKASGLNWVILRPTWFMENFGRFVTAQGLMLPVEPKQEIDMIAVKTIGQFAAAALQAPERFASHTIELASDRLTFPRAMELLSEACGHKVPYTQVPLEKAAPAYHRMFEWFNEESFRVERTALNQWGIHLTDFKEHLADAPYVKLLSPSRERLAR